MTKKPNDFVLTYEWAIIEHLGLNLYSEVHSAISELIANAYDADATTVDVTLPIGVPLGLRGQKIIVEDNGHGMTYEECRDKFLRVGLNRRRQSTKSKSGRRRVIGKKGIGKLAGFGIADVITVRTISGGQLNEFQLSLQALREAPEVKPRGKAAQDKDAADVAREYHPRLIYYKKPTKEKNGTTVTLEELRHLDKVNFDDFERRLSRKFAIFGDDFKVTIRKAKSTEFRVIAKFSVETQFRFPQKGWALEWVETPTMGPQKVKYWIGFTKSPIKDDALRGISVIANGKSVQEPFEFRVSGGVTGQFGLQYMTGEVHADWMDDPKKVDVIASDRASVRWSDLDAHALLKWGQEKVKACLEKWVELRTAHTQEEVRTSAPDVYAAINAYQGPAREELRRVVDRVVSTIAQVSESRRIEVVRSIVTAYSHEHVRQVFARIMRASGGWDEWVQALAELDIVDAVLTFQELSGKLMALQTLQALIEGRATEVRGPGGLLSLHEHLAAYPWLIDPMFREMDHEINIDNFLKTKYGDAPIGDRKRADFIAIYDSARVRIVEIKGAAAPIDQRGMTNLMDYHHRVKTGEGSRNKGEQRDVRTLLIYNGECADATTEGMLDVIRKARDEYDVYTWRELLDRNTMIYKEQLIRLREKAPTDPRVVPLWEALKNRLGPARSSAERKQQRRRGGSGRRNKNP